MTLRTPEGKIRPTETWGPADFARGEEILQLVLSGLGDERQQREFRMCSTLCRHRAVTSAEALRLPASWWTDVAQDLAGGPVELLWERGIPPSLSTQPCEKPHWHYLDPFDPRLKFPLDCGRCASCQARSACHSRPMRFPPARAEGAMHRK